MDSIIEHVNMYEDELNINHLVTYLFDKNGNPTNLNNIDYVLKYCISHNTTFVLTLLLNLLSKKTYIKNEIFYKTLIYSIEYKSILLLVVNNYLKSFEYNSLKNSVVINCLKKHKTEKDISKCIELVDLLQIDEINSDLLDKFIDMFFVVL